MSTKFEIFTELEKSMNLSLQQAAHEAQSDTEKAIATIREMQQHHASQHRAADNDRSSEISSEIIEIKERIAKLFGKGKNRLLGYLSTRHDELDFKVTELTEALEVAELQVRDAEAAVPTATSQAGSAKENKAALEAIQAELVRLNGIISDKKSNIPKGPLRTERDKLLEAHPFLERDLRSAQNRVNQATARVTNAQLRLNAATQIASRVKQDLKETARLLDSVKKEVARLSPATSPSSNEAMPRATAVTATTPETREITETIETTLVSQEPQQSDLGTISAVPVVNASEAERQRRERILGRFTQSLDTLKVEVDRLRDEGLTEDEASCLPSFNQDSAAAANAGIVLYDALIELKNTFIRDDSMTVEQFKNDCNPLISTALDSALAKQPFWPEFLYNLLFVVANILTLGAASGISYLATGDVRFFKVPEKDAAILVNDLQNEVSQVSANNSL